MLSLLKHISVKLAKYLDIRDYVRLCEVLRLPIIISEIILICGALPSGPSRLKLWKNLLSMGVIQRNSLKQIDFQEYIWMAEVDKDCNSDTAGIIGEIMRDTRRTFPSHPFFGNPLSQGEIMLGRVLRAIAHAHPAVGYCQGMNFVCGVLILARVPSEITENYLLHSMSMSRRLDDVEDSDDDIEFIKQTRKLGIEQSSVVYTEQDFVLAEYDIFTVLRMLLDKEGKLGMHGMWQSGVPKMKLRVYQLDNILRWTLPKLHSHFTKIQLTPEILVAQWFITLFSYTVSIHRTMLIWDYIFFEGWSGIFRVVLSILKILEPIILEVDLDGLGRLMRNWKKTVNAIKFNHEEIIRKSKQMIINDEVLLKLQESYALEMISKSEASVSLGSNSASPSREPSVHEDDRKPHKDSWLDRYGNSSFSDQVASDMLRVRDDLRSMELQVDVDKKLIQNKIRKACEAHRDAQLRFDAALQEQIKFMTEVSNYSHELEVALHRAAVIAEAATTEQDRITKESSISVAVSEDSLSAASAIPAENINELLQAAYFDQCTPRNDGSAKVLDVRQRRTESCDSDDDIGFNIPHNVPILAAAAAAAAASASSQLPPITNAIQVYSKSGSKSFTFRSGQGNNSVPSLRSAAQSSGIVYQLDRIRSTDDSHPTVQSSKTNLISSKRRSSDSVSTTPEKRNISLDEFSPGDESLTYRSHSLRFCSSQSPEPNRSRASSENCSDPTLPAGKFGALGGALRGGVGKVMQLASSLASAASSPSSTKTGSSWLQSPKRGNHKRYNGNAHMSHFASQSQLYQRDIIRISRELDISRQNLDASTEELVAAKQMEEDMAEWKKSLCDQLQRLVEDANRGRSQKLQYLSDTYIV